MAEEHLQINRRVELEFTDERGRIREFPSRIEEIEGESFLVQMPIEKGKHVELSQKSSCRVYINEGNKKVFADVKVLENKKEGVLPLVRLEKPSGFKEMPRRSFFREETSLPIRVEEKAGEAYNLSGSGLFALINENINWKEGQILKLELELPTEKFPLVLKGKVVRREKIDTDKKGFGLDFVSISEKARDQIIKYLFAKQRRELKEER